MEKPIYNKKILEPGHEQTRYLLRNVVKWIPVPYQKYGISFHGNDNKKIQNKRRTARAVLLQFLILGAE
jgi:hypothetical protein